MRQSPAHLSIALAVAASVCLSISMLGGCSRTQAEKRPVPSVVQAKGEPQFLNMVRETESTEWTSMEWSSKRQLWAASRYDGPPVLVLHGRGAGVIHLGTPTTAAVSRSAATTVSADGSMLAASLVTGPSSHEIAHLVTWPLKGRPAGHELSVEHADILALAFSPDNAMLAVATADNAVSLRSLKDGAILATLLTGQSNRGAALSVCFSVDGSHLWVARKDGTILFVAVPTMKTDRVYPPASTSTPDELTAFTISPKGGTFVRGYLSGQVDAVNTTSGATLFSKNLTDSVYRRVASVGFFGNSNFVIIATRSKKDKLLPGADADADAITSEFFVFESTGRSITSTITGLPQVEAMAIDDAAALLMVASPEGIQRWLLPEAPSAARSD